ncbi:MAG: YegS/Rv2252/BmrU family lipid kinase [Vulcanibacillus sp.]
MKVLLIYNPYSDDGDFKNNLDYVIDRFQQKGIQAIIYRMSNHDLLSKRISVIDEKEYKKVVIVGGNRTVNIVINSLLKYNINLPIAIFPIGLKNEYTNYNLPKTVEEMMLVVLTDNYTSYDVGLVNERHFINYASIGFVIDIDKRIRTRVKKNIGVIANYITGIEKIINQKSINISIMGKEFSYHGDILFMLIMNDKSAGKYKKIAPDAITSDGLFDVFILKKCPSDEAMNLMTKIANGEAVDSPYIIHFKTDELTIDSSDSTKIVLDGEKGPNFPLKFNVLPKKIEVNTLIKCENNYRDKRFFNLYQVKRAAGQISKGVIFEFRNPKKEIQKNRSLIKDMLYVIKDFPRHSPLNYVNKNTIKEEYFEIAQKTMDNGYLYLIISSTGSPAGEVVLKFTKKRYSHTSISFDEELKTIISYNGGEKISPPGINHERLDFFYQKPDANMIIYRLNANRFQKNRILDEIRRINEEGSSFNLLGFLSYSHRKNIMICSQFVYNMLEAAGLNYFNKKPVEVRPTDFIELDYGRRLEYCNEFLIKDIIDNSSLLTNYIERKEEIR